MKDHLIDFIHLPEVEDDTIWENDRNEFFENHPDPLQWSLHPLRFPRLRGTETSRAREETALLGARNRFALKLADHQRSSPYCAGWDRLNAMFSIPNLKPYLHESAKSKD